MSLVVLKDAVLMKCESRAQQIGLAMCMALFVTALVGVGLWMLSMGNATLETVTDNPDLVRRRGGSRRSGGIGGAMLFFYAGAAVSAVLSVLFALVGIVNLVRFMTNTGVKETDSW